MVYIRHVWKAQSAGASLRLKSKSMSISKFNISLVGPGQGKSLGEVTLGSHQDVADIIIGGSEISAAMNRASGPFNYFRFLINVVHHRAVPSVTIHGWTYALLQNGAVLDNGIDQDGVALALSGGFVDWQLTSVNFAANAAGIAAETIIFDVADAL